jgi:glycosyltransferase involved in cell wall biosynthesis
MPFSAHAAQAESEPMKISVAMCTFNGEPYLQEQLNSFARQTRPPDELVICDDRSSDETLNIIDSFARTARFSVHVSVNEHTLGSTRNFEQAITRCSGDIIALSDQDDVWLPAKLALLEAEFGKSARVGLVFSDAEVVDQDLRPTGRRMWNEVSFCQREKELVKDSRALDVFLPGWTVTGATMAFRSKFRDLILPIPADLPMIHDGWIALMIAAVAEVDYIDEPLILYRQHPQQQIGAPAKHDVSRANGETKLQSIKRATNRSNSYRDLIIIIDEVLQRLRSRYDLQSLNLNTRKTLDERRKHLVARMQLPARILVRLPVVLRELLSTRYSRFSNGTASALKDLIKGNSPVSPV